jgi:UDP-N-acetylmuramate--alanine ligase
VGRRFQNYGKVRLAGGGSFTLIDDYGHHPAEMAATLAAARGAFPDSRGPARVPAAPLHAHPRLFRGLRRGAVHGDAAGADRGLSRRRSADRGGRRPRARARRARAGQGRADIRGEVADLPAAVLAAARDGDLVLMMGAGSIGGIAPQLGASRAHGEWRVTRARV